MYLPITTTKNNTNTCNKEKKLNVFFCMGLWTFEPIFIYQMRIFFSFCTISWMSCSFYYRSFWKENGSKNCEKLMKTNLKFSRPFWTVTFMTMVWLQVSHMSKVFCWQITASKFCSEFSKFYCDLIGSVIWIRKIVYARIKKSIIRLESLAQQKLYCDLQSCIML